MTLAEYLKANEIGVVAFSDLIGIDHSTTYRILSGSRLPSLEVAFVIQYYTKGKVRADSYLRTSPASYLQDWRNGARKSANPERRARATALRARHRATEAA
jgi:hypothetical protein